MWALQYSFDTSLVYFSDSSTCFIIRILGACVISGNLCSICLRSNSVSYCYFATLMATLSSVAVKGESSTRLLCRIVIVVNDAELSLSYSISKQLYFVIPSGEL